ncbi:MAG: DUF1549 domain-containing protein [Planctomycetota bacterium]
MNHSVFRCQLFLAALMVVGSISCCGTATAQSVDANETISFAKHVRPILAAKCFGCHQGNINRGDYVMTQFESLLAGGESGEAAIVPGQPDESRLLDLIATHDGKAEMPPEGDPVSEVDFDVIRKWIADGAKNDHQNERPIFTQKNPPTYSRQPFITSLDVAPDGKTIAISGFHEVLILESPLVDKDLTSIDSESLANATIRHRLIGLSSRIEKVRFSPDGKRLAVAGGRPAEFGEIQVWDTTNGQLQLSKTVAHDTVFGVNWSPDSRLISFGCTDTTVRVIDASSGAQVLFQGAHDDWVLDTVFSKDAKQLVSVGRDMSCKLIDVPTERFVDNITSITPGVLKGGIAAVARDPQDNFVAIGGADGVPRLYRMNRLTKRVIGDDANLIKAFPKLEGRINAIAISHDGKRLAAVSSLDGKGHLGVYSLEFDKKQPDDIKAIVSKVVSAQNAKEKKRLKEYVTGGPALAQLSFDQPLYSVDFSHDGTWLAIGGTEGVIRFLATETGKSVGQLVPIEPETSPVISEQNRWTYSDHERPNRPDVKLKLDFNVVDLVISPPSIQFAKPTDYVQLVVQAKLEDDSLVDVSHHVQIGQFDNTTISVHGSLIEPLANGTTILTLSFEGLVKNVPVSVELDDAEFSPNFIRDVNPVLTKLGCNAGTCHGSQGGKKGFKLSLRGYDPLYDIRSFTDELGSRRVNLIAPHQSLMLMKPSALVPHEGGQLVKPGDKYFSLIQKWIADGAILDMESPRVTEVKVLPENPVLNRAGDLQQMRVVASYSDGSTVDVTHEAVVEIGNIEIAKVDGSHVTALRRGEAAILARYEGAFTSTTLTVMGDRTGFQWQPPESWSTIDELVAAKWERLKIQPSGLCDDAEFVRRVYLDLTGLPPNVEQVNSFLGDKRPTREKRNELIEQLIGSEAFVEHWSNKWADLMQVNRKYLGTEGATSLRSWLRDQVRDNRPYDEFAREILTASGSNKDNPAAAYYKIHRTPEDAMENTTHLFLATRFNCNKCHDHPFERWTQDQYYETAAFFAQIKRAPDPQSEGKKVGGTAVEGAKPLYELISDQTQGDILHVRTGKVVTPKFPFEANQTKEAESPRRQQLAQWITSPENPYFATSYVNRLWGYMMGAGLIEPLDDIRAGNPPSNPELLEHLRSEFVKSDFDMRHVIRLICQSRTYQLSVETNRFNTDDDVNFSHALARRLPAEVLFDSIHSVTGSKLNIPGVKPGTRAAALPDSGVTLPSGFLSTLGRPSRESVCECERSNDLQLGSVLAFVSGPDLAKAINDPNNAIAKLVAAEADDSKLVDQIFMRVLNRPATPEEIELSISAFKEIQGDHDALVKQRDQRQTWFDNERPKLESARSQAIEAAKKETDAAVAKFDPALIKKESDREQAIASAEKALADYAASAESYDQWKQRQLYGIQWHPLVIERLKTKSKRGYTVRADRSVLIKKEKLDQSDSVAYASTDLTGISHVRLELLADDALPNKGPGLADNGNFVLSEFEVEIADPQRPDQWNPVKIVSGRVDFMQQGFPIENTFDGKKNRQGWAVHPEGGKTHWATFKLQMPIGYSQGSLLRFRFTQKHDEQHRIGCFRISVSRYHDDAGLSLSESLIAQLTRPGDTLSKEERQQLEALAKRDDVQMARLTEAVATAKKPVEVHPEIEKARKKLARMERPVPIDATLAELQRNLKQSETQLANRRLTAAQDLTWALINSPAFLFNH